MISIHPICTIFTFDVFINSYALAVFLNVDVLFGIKRQSVYRRSAHTDELRLRKPTLLSISPHSLCPHFRHRKSDVGICIENLIIQVCISSRRDFLESKAQKSHGNCRHAQSSK